MSINRFETYAPSLRPEGDKMACYRSDREGEESITYDSLLGMLHDLYADILNLDPGDDMTVRFTRTDLTPADYLALGEAS